MRKVVLAATAVLFSVPAQAQFANGFMSGLNQGSAMRTRAAVQAQAEAAQQQATALAEQNRLMREQIELQRQQLELQRQAQSGQVAQAGHLPAPLPPRAVPYDFYLLRTDKLDNGTQECVFTNGMKRTVAIGADCFK